MSYYVGCDWASTAHQIGVINAHGQIVWQNEVPHTAEGCAALRRRLQRFGAPADVPVGIERPSGLIVDLLLEWGHPVVPIQPNALKASRSRYRISGAKSDASDAFILADLLRTDGHRFRAMNPVADETRALRTLVRTRDDLVATRIGLANQLRAVLEGFWPGAAQVFADIDSPIALAFLERYPTPEAPSISAKSGSRPSSAATATVAAAPRASCSSGCAAPRPSSWARRTLRPPVRSSAPWSPSWSTSSPKFRNSRVPSRRRCESIRMARSSCRSHGPAAPTRPKSSPNWARSGCASRRWSDSPRKPASSPSRWSLANTAESPSAGPATSASGEPSRSLPTTRVGPRRGLHGSINAPWHAVAITPTPYASWPGLGSASCGGVGSLPRPMRSATTGRLNASA